jgi:hypothetical protein
MISPAIKSNSEEILSQRFRLRKDYNANPVPLDRKNFRHTVSTSDEPKEVSKTVRFS